MLADCDEGDREREGEEMDFGECNEGGGAFVSNTHKSQSILIHIARDDPPPLLER